MLMGWLTVHNLFRALDGRVWQTMNDPQHFPNIDDSLSTGVRIKTLKKIVILKKKKQQKNLKIWHGENTWNAVFGARILCQIKVLDDIKQKSQSSLWCLMKWECSLPVTGKKWWSLDVPLGTCAHLHVLYLTDIKEVELKRWNRSSTVYHFTKQSNSPSVKLMT